MLSLPAKLLRGSIRNLHQNIKANRYGFKKYGNNQQHGQWRRIAVVSDFATSNWKMQFLHLNIPTLQVQIDEHIASIKNSGGEGRSD